MISIIIPTLNEEKNIKKTILSIVNYLKMEVIVVDGGSLDETLFLARELGVKTIISKPGRAIQMNKGAEQSKGDILLFLHADTRLPCDFESSVHETLNLQKTGAGAFRLTIGMQGAGARLVEKFTNIRSKYFQLPYGDQAIFIKKSTFEKVGGFDNITFLEDYLLVRKVRKLGRIRITGSEVVTSGRRWERLGVLKTTLINQGVIVGYLLGFSIPFLKKLYRIP